MKALSKLKSEKGIWMIHDADIPKISPSEVLIKIKKSAICGTDVHIYNWDEWAKKTIPVPMIVGHEYIGEVVEVGCDVTTITIDQRVSGEGHIVCGHCRNCRGGRLHLCPNTKGIGVNIQGSFAEYLKLPASNVCPIPDEIPDEIAAIFDPFGNAVHTALSFNLVGEDVLITGAGAIGIMAAAVCRHAGARHVIITDINPYKLDLARKMGVKHAINVQETDLKTLMAELNINEGFDVALEMSGAAPAFTTILDTIIHGGKVALLGIPPADMSIDWNQVIFKGLTIKGIYGREMYETWHKMKMMVMGDLDISPIITHQFHIDDYQEAFEVACSGQSGKVILNWE
jgi:threonine 3-dehydrogenase